MVALLERAGVKAFSIWTYTGQGRPDDQDLDKLQADVASWKVPSLAMVRGTTLGLTHFAFYFPAGLGTFSMRQPDGSILRISAPAGPGLMQEQFDAVLYLGPTKSITYSRPSAALCADPDYVAMRVRRIAVMAPPPPQAAPTASAKAQRSVSDDMIDAFKARCLAQAQR